MTAMPQARCMWDPNGGECLDDTHRPDARGSRGGPDNDWTRVWFAEPSSLSNEELVEAVFEATADERSCCDKRRFLVRDELLRRMRAGKSL